MKTILKSISFLVVGICILLIPIGCNNDDDAIGNGVVHLSFQNKSDTNGRTQASEVSGALISIETSDGTSVFATEEITFYDFNGKMISEAILLPVDTYLLTEFHLIDALGSVIYSTPVVGSELDYLVDNPLPITITVLNNSVITVEPEVLSTAEFSPEDFGYSSFSYSHVETVNFMAAVFAFNTDPQILDWELTDASISITNGQDILYEDLLEPVTNEILIRQGVEDLYQLVVTKEGYNDIVEEYTLQQLEFFSEAPLLLYLTQSL